MRCKVWKKVLVYAIPCIVGIAWPFFWSSRNPTQDEELRNARELLGVTYDGSGILIAHPLSFSKIEEGRMDADGDGKCDTDFVFVGPVDGRTTLYSYANGSDEDGQIDRVVFQIGSQITHCLVEYRPRFGLWGFSPGNLSGVAGPFVLYRDLNMDGVVDAMDTKIMGKRTRFVLSGGKWTGDSCQ